MGAVHGQVVKHRRPVSMREKHSLEIAPVFLFCCRMVLCTLHTIQVETGRVKLPQLIRARYATICGAGALGSSVFGGAW